MIQIEIAILGSLFISCRGLRLNRPAIQQSFQDREDCKQFAKIIDNKYHVDSIVQAFNRTDHMLLKCETRAETAQGWNAAGTSNVWLQKDCTNAMAEQFRGISTWSTVLNQSADVHFPPWRDTFYDKTYVGNMIFNAHDQLDVLIFNTFFNDPPLWNGSFIEFGAWDGLKHSVSLAFERYFGWRGLLLEPTTCSAQAKRNRPNSHVINAGICDQPGNFTADQWSTECMSAGAVPCLPLQHHLDNMGPASMRHIDLLIADTEGHEIVDIKTIDYERTKISVMIVEANMHDEELVAYLKPKGFKQLSATSDFSYSDMIFWNPAVLQERRLQLKGCSHL